MYWLNNKYYKTDPMGNDFFYGYSLFETIMGINKRLIFLEDHLKRIKNSCEILGIKNKINKDKIYELIEKENLKENEEFLVKIQVSDKNIYIKLEKTKLRVFDKGIKVKIIKKFYQNESGYMKSGNYITNILARKELVKNGFFEGIFLNRINYLTEGTISNLFFVKNNIIKTPDLSLNILPGITRKKIIQIIKKMKLEVQEGFFTIEDLLESDGIFFTNSLMKKGLLWVNEIEGINKEKNVIFHNLEKEYLKMIDNML